MKNEITVDDSSIIIDEVEVLKARMLTLRAALKLEVLGMTRHGKSAYSIIKSEYGFKGSKLNVLTQLNEYIDFHKISG